MKPETGNPKTGILKIKLKKPHKMKTQAYLFNGKLSVYEWEMVSISILVTAKMIENVIKRSGTRRWEINKIGLQGLSNCTRNCAVMTYSNSINFVHDVLQKLKIEWVNSSDVVEYYRVDLEDNSSKTDPSRFILFNSKTKKSKFVASTPFPIVGIQSRGSGQTAHLLARKIS